VKPLIAAAFKGFLFLWGTVGRVGLSGKYASVFADIGRI